MKKQDNNSEVCVSESKREETSEPEFKEQDLALQDQALGKKRANKEKVENETPRREDNELQVPGKNQNLVTEGQMQTNRGLMTGAEEDEVPQTVADIEAQQPGAQIGKGSGKCSKTKIFCSLGVVSVASVGALVGLWQFKQDHKPTKAHMSHEESPMITVDGAKVLVEWHTDKGSELSFEDFTVQIETAQNVFKDVDCRETAQDYREPCHFVCDFDAALLMGDEFQLYYGDSINARIQAPEDETLEVVPSADSADVLAPYLAGHLEFGYHKYGYYPLDYVRGSYPTQDQVKDIDITDDLRPEWIKIQTRKTVKDHNRLHGVQIGFSDGSESPLFQGFGTEEETEEVVLYIDPSRDIKGISLKQWKDNLSGIRMVDEKGEYIVDYTWQEHFETGEWSDMQSIPAGKAIIGLVVNEPQADIYRLGFLLWDKYPELLDDYNLNV